MKFLIQYISSSKMKNIIHDLSERKYLLESAKALALVLRKIISREMNPIKDTGTSVDDKGGSKEPDKNMSTMQVSDMLPVVSKMSTRIRIKESVFSTEEFEKLRWSSRAS